MKPASTVLAVVSFILPWLVKEAYTESNTNATKDLQKEETSWQNRPPISHRPGVSTKGGWSGTGLGNTGYGSGSGGYGSSGYGGSGYGNTGYGSSGYGNTGYGNTGYGNIGYGNNGYGNTGYGNSGYGSGGQSGNAYGGYIGGNTGWHNNYGNSKGYTDYNRDIYMTNYGGNDWRKGQGYQPGYGTSNYLQGNQWRGDRNFGHTTTFGNYQPYNEYGSGYGNQIYGSGYSGDNYGYQHKGYGGYGNFGGFPREQGGYPGGQGSYLKGNRGHSIDENRRRGDVWPSGRRQGNFKGSFGGHPQGRQNRNVGYKGSAFISRNVASQNRGW